MSKRDMGGQMDEATHALYEAVGRYAEAHGGSVAVAGGVEIQQWPGDRKMNFRVAIKCTGRVPEYAKRQEGGDGE